MSSSESKQCGKGGDGSDCSVSWGTISVFTCTDCGQQMSGWSSSRDIANMKQERCPDIRSIRYHSDSNRLTYTHPLYRRV
jgi:hypothetical protein